MEKQKKYAVRKIAGYGLVSCAVGFGDRDVETT